MSSVKDWTASVIKQAEIDKYLDGGIFYKNLWI